MKKIICLVLAIILLLSMASGCSVSQNDSTSSDVLDSADDVSTENEDEPTVEKETNVVIKGYGFTAGYTGVVEQFVPAFNSLEPNVSIDWEIAGEDPYTVLKTRFASDEAPDIFDLAPGDLAAWSEYCADLSNEPFVSNLQLNSKESVTMDGKVLGFPYAVEGNGFLYNKDLFEQAGIAQVPTTLDELEEACIKLEAAGIQPFGEAWKEWGFLMHILGTTFAYEDNEQEVCDKLNSGELKLADLSYIDNFFRLFDLTLDYGKGAESIGYGVVDQMADFASGKMAMVKQGTWMTDYLYSTNPEINVGLFPVPLTNDASQTKLMVATTRYLVLNKDSENLEEAKAFLDWFYNNIKTYVVDGVRIAAPYDGLDISNLGPLNEDMFTYLENGKTYPSIGSTYWPSGFHVDIATPLQAYAAGAIDKDEAIAQLQQLYDSRAKALTN